jgi:hypothetical protein
MTKSQAFLVHGVHDQHHGERERNSSLKTELDENEQMYMCILP